MTHAPVNGDRPPWPGRRPRIGRLGIRGRVFAWFVVLVGASLLVSYVLLRSVLAVQADERIDRGLRAEADAFRTWLSEAEASLVGGDRPAVGGLSTPEDATLSGLFTVYLRTAAPAKDQLFLALVGDTAYAVSAPELFGLDALTTGIFDTLDDDEGSFGTVRSPDGSIRYVSVPVVLGDTAVGAFVIAERRDPEHVVASDAARTIAVIAMLSFTSAAALAWGSSRRALQPVRDLADATTSIDERDLSARLPVTGTDEIAVLTRRFNAMLDRLEHAFATQKTFLDDAAHELRTPLTIVRGHLEVMGTDPADQPETLMLVLSELDRMEALVRDLAVLARSERPDFIQPEDLELRDFGDRVMAHATALADRSWKVDATTDGRCTADPARLMQAVQNLLGNAVKFTDTGDEIGFGISGVDEGLQIWVRDRGPGLAPTEHERVFERFAQVADSGHAHEGAGLGLAIVSAVASGHGGSVTVESRPGEGSRFTIHLPRALLTGTRPPAASEPRSDPDG